MDEAGEPYQSLAGLSRNVTFTEIRQRDYVLNPRLYVAPAAELPDMANAAAAISELRAELTELHTRADVRNSLDSVLSQIDLSPSPARWERTDLGSVCEILAGPGQVARTEFQVSLVPVVLPRNIRHGRIDDRLLEVATEQESVRYRLAAGDIVCPRTGEFGRGGVASSGQEGWLLGPGCIRLRPTHRCARQQRAANGTIDQVTWTVLLGFVAVLTLAYLVPGPDFAVILRSATRSATAGRAAALGAQTGLCVHMLAAVVGISAVLARSAEAFTVLKLAGAAYLCYLGIRALWSTRRGAPSEKQVEPGAGPGFRANFTRGVLSNVLNPKAALFFLSLLPQFVDHTAPVTPQVLLLGTIDIAFGVVYWLVFVRCARVLGNAIGRRGVRRMLDRITGSVFLGLGVTLATAEAR